MAVDRLIENKVYAYRNDGGLEVGTLTKGEDAWTFTTDHATDLSRVGRSRDGSESWWLDNLSELTPDDEFLPEPNGYRDISDELYRVYTFPAGQFAVRAPVLIRIPEDQPKRHEIVDADGVYHFVEPYWIAVSCKILPESEISISGDATGE